MLRSQRLPPARTVSLAPVLALCALPLAACGSEQPPGPPVEVSVFVQDAMERSFATVTFTEANRVLAGRCANPADLELADGGVVDQHGSTPCLEWIVKLTPGTHVLGVAVRHYVTEYVAVQVDAPPDAGEAGRTEVHVQMARVHYVRVDAGGNG